MVILVFILILQINVTSDYLFLRAQFFAESIYHQLFDTKLNLRLLYKLGIKYKQETILQIQSEIESRVLET